MQFLKVYPFEAYSDTGECISGIPYFYDGCEFGGYNSDYDYQRSKLQILYLCSFLKKEGISLERESKAFCDDFGELTDSLREVYNVLWKQAGITFICDESISDITNETDFLDFLGCEVSDISEDFSTYFNEILYLKHCIAVFVECPIDVCKCDEIILEDLNESCDLDFCIPTYFSSFSFCFRANYHNQSGFVCVIAVQDEIDYTSYTCDNLFDFCSLTISCLLARRHLLNNI